MNIYIYWMSRTRLLTARRELYSEAVGLGSNLLKNKEKRKKKKKGKKEQRKTKKKKEKERKSILIDEMQVLYKKPHWGKR